MTEDGDSGAAPGDSADIDEATVQDIVRALRDCKGHYSFLIGAGTSRPAGIPTGGDLIWEWQQERYVEEHDEIDGSDDVDDDGIERWANSYEDDHAHQDSYGFWFEEVHTTPGERRHLIREKVENKDPTFGNIVLAALMADGYVPLTLTPNFDDLVFDALYRFLEQKPLVINHDAVAAEFSLTKDRPTIIKLHGDYLFENLQNLDEETEKLKGNMERAFSLALNEYGLIVVGYGGDDTSIMDEVLLNDMEIPEYGIYWCARERDRLSEKAEQLLDQENTYFVEIEGSEPFFSKLANRIPGFTPPGEEDLDEIRDQKVEVINQKIEKAGEDAKSEEVEDYTDSLQYKSKAYELAEANEWEEVLEVASKLVSVAPEEPAGHFYRGLARDELGDHERAIENYDEAIKLDPEHAVAYNNRGNSYRELDDHERAIEDYDEAIKINPEYINAYNGRGNSYNDLGEYERAIKDYDEAIKIDPEFAAAYNGRGNSYNRLGDYERAIEDYDEAIKLDPDNPTPYNNRAEAWLEVEEYEQARDDAQEAYELAKDNDDVAVSLLLLLISKTVLDEKSEELEKEYQNTCDKEFTTSWEFTGLERLIDKIEIDDENEYFIRDMISLLKTHTEDH